MNLLTPTLTLEECFHDFKTRFPKNDPKRLLLGEFTGASQGRTIGRWLGGQLQPTGEYKWRSIAFFTLLGYTIPQFVNIRPLYQRAIQLFALGVMDAKKLATEGFGFQGVNATHKMYQAFERDRSTMPERETALRQYLKQHTEDLEAAKQLFDEQYGVIKLALPEVAGTPEPSVPKILVQPVPVRLTQSLPATAPVKPKLSHDILLGSAANLIQGLLPLLELIASDAFTAAERAQLRDSTGRDGVFKLSNVLEQLCGERARSQTTKQGAK